MVNRTLPLTWTGSVTLVVGGQGGVGLRERLAGQG